MKIKTEWKCSDFWFKAGMFFVLLFVLVIVYAKPYMEDVFLYSGDGYTEISRLAFIKEAIQEGEWPLWNKYLSAGMPAAGNISFGSFYLPSIILSFLPLKLYVYSHYILHLAVGAFFFFLLLEQIGCRRVIAVAMSFVYLFSVNLGGARREHASIVITIAYVPVIIYWIEKYLQSQKFLWLGIAAAAMALQFMGGFVQCVFYTDIFVGFYLLVGVFLHNFIDRKKIFMHIMGWIVLYMGFIAVQLIPFLELLKENSAFDQRTDTYEYFLSLSLHPIKILMMLFPQFFGNIYYSIGSHYSSGIDIELYMGPVVAAILFAGIITYRREKRVVAYGIGSLLIICWASMACFPRIAWIISKIPFLGSTRVQSRVLFLFVLLALMMTAYICELVARNNKYDVFEKHVVKNMKWLIASVMTVLMGMLLYAATFGDGDQACVEVLGVFRNKVFKDLCLFLAASVALVMIAHSRNRKKIAKSCLIFSLICINMIGILPYALTYGTTPVEDYLGVDDSQSDFLKKNIGNEKAWEDAVFWEQYFNSILYSNKGVAKKIACINSYTNFTNPRLYMMLNGVGTAPLNESGALIANPSAEMNLRCRNDMLSMLGIKYVRDTGNFLNDQFFITSGLEKAELFFTENVEGELYNENLYVAGYDVNIQKNKTYKISMEAFADTETTVSVDFYGDQYDNPAQQKELQLTAEKQKFSFVFFSGNDVPENVLVRVIGNPQQANFTIQNLRVTQLQEDAQRPYRLVSPGEGGNIYENLNANEILYFSNTKTLTKETDLYTTVGLSLDQNSYVEGGKELKNFSENKKISNVEFGINHIYAEVSSDEDSFVNFSQTYYPGWRAFVDGKEQEILTVNGVIMGIYVPQGKHIIRFAFQPFSVTLGMVISAVSFLILIVLIWLQRKVFLPDGESM